MTTDELTITRDGTDTPIDAPLPCRLLLEIATGLASAEQLWRPHLLDRVDHLDRRASVRLLATDRYEAWLLQWAVGHRVELHDHGDSAGAFTVVEGELIDLEAAGSELVRRVINPGRRRTFSPGCIHDVLNAGTGAAASIHVYSPPLTSMTFYDPLTLAPVRTEPVDHETPVLNGSASRFLHPARSHP